ncbi:MAG TPA: type I-B CRISPR-associated protein Cas7/Csh2 [Clostridiaceae bacterium]|jgi:CRISPR-associated protein Csh2|nr:type I-B CRISPR-associated protein Cas7/Csh2 [Clostridiaceae bacterium]
MNNSEILYLYDARLANPNGDPDEENRPRMDYERDINLVSDLRLKRYIRDYLESKGYLLYVRKLDGNPVKPEEIIKRVKDQSKEGVLNEFIDVRLFGATMPIKGDNRTFIGPVQFNWGYSLNKVELLESSITSHFATMEGNKQGAIGKDYRVKYSFIAFSGVISGKRAAETKLTEDDIKLLDQSMKYAIPSLATRSKIGQYPRLYMRVEYNDDETILGDMRDYICLHEKVESIRDISECNIDITNIGKFLSSNKDRIKTIHYFADEKLELISGSRPVTFEEAFDDFNILKIK